MIFFAIVYSPFLSDDVILPYISPEINIEFIFFCTARTAFPLKKVLRKQEFEAEGNEMNHGLPLP